MTTPDAAYSGDPATSPLDEVRFLIGDTCTPYLLGDAEITYLLNKWMPLYASVLFTASQAALTLARAFAGLSDVSADGVSVAVAGLGDKYRALATDLRGQYEDERDMGLPIFDVMWNETPDCSIPGLSFAIGMHDMPGLDQETWWTPFRYLVLEDLGVRE